MRQPVKFNRAGTLAAALIVVALLVAGCGSDSNSDSADQADAGGATQSSSTPVSTVDATLKEWSITTNAPEAKAGDVTFDATNDGDSPHELVVLKTDQPAGSLKVGSGGTVSESDSVGEIPDLDAGKSGSKKLDLKPGKYVLVCNLPGHYQQGMYTALTVK